MLGGAGFRPPTVSTGAGFPPLYSGPAIPSLEHPDVWGAHPDDVGTKDL